MPERATTEKPGSEPTPARGSLGFGWPPRLPAWTLLVAGTLLSCLSASYVQRTNQQMGVTWLSDHASQIRREIRARLEAYEDALIHTRALFQASRSTGRDLFRRYIKDVNLLQQYPGSLGIGFISKVPHEELAAFERHQRKSVPGFKVWPAGPRDVFYPVTYYEPDSAENRKVLGFDSSTWPDRREAQLRALQTNRPAATAKIVLVRDQPVQRSPGFLYFLPVYRPGAPIGTLAERQSAQIGFVLSAFRVSTFMEAMIGPRPIASGIAFDIYDGETKAPEAILFNLRLNARRGSGPELTDRLEVGGRTWTIDFYTTPRFGTFWSRQGHWLVLLAGLLITALVHQILRATLRREEKERALVAQVRQALHTRDEFISIAAHELRTPITSLKLQFEMIRRYGSADPAKTLARVSLMGQQQVRRLTDLINALLDVARIQSGKLRVNRLPTDLNVLVAELLEELRESSAGGEPPIELKNPQSPVFADVDPLRLGQAVENLLSNALKYGGRHPVELRVEKTANHGLIRIRDKGIGIPLEQQERIFRRFERAVDSENVSGLGLGLYIAKQIVDAHHGSIRVQSAPGEGSTFTIELPLADAAAFDQAAASSEPARFA